MPDLVAFSTAEPQPVTIRAKTHDVILREFSDNPKRHHELAVYSEERPIEFWRNIYGFREGDQV